MLFLIQEGEEKMKEPWLGLPPREKLFEFGAHALSDVELLAIFLRIGSRGVHVMTLGTATR